MMEDIIARLTAKDDKAAYECAKEISAESAQSDKYLSMIPEFAGLLTHDSSFVRTRGFMLICAQARWAKDGEIGDVFDQMVPLLNDPKPTAVRQCLLALHEVALYRPEMNERIEKAIDGIDLTKYKDSMTPLITKDIESLRRMIE
ncbi:MAG: hypothetical protein Q4B67_07950 [Eubacteriales bacterium]|nr:hypothetical protein [Eubacteriales bacterium]